MPQHLTTAELAVVETMRGKDRATKQIVEALQARRARQGEAGPSSTSVYDFLKNKTYRRDAPENRGRKRKLSKVGSRLFVLNRVLVLVPSSQHTHTHMYGLDTPGGLRPPSFS